MTLTADGIKKQMLLCLASEKALPDFEFMKASRLYRCLMVTAKGGHYIPRLPKADRDCSPLRRCIAADEEARAIRELPTPANLKDLR